LEEEVNIEKKKIEGQTSCYN